jgi:hypothetical protein
MLIAAAAIWLTLRLLALAFCRAAASADSNVTLSPRYPSRTAHPLRAGATAAARAAAGRVPPRGEAGAAGGVGAGGRRALGV